eukprot:COSAG05_NODE_1033_length_6088_cov_21.220738_5_plen_123_part_00
MVGQATSLIIDIANGQNTWESMDVVKGVGNCQNCPPLQGWYSPDYDKEMPSPVAIAKTRIFENATFAWVIATSASTTPPTIKSSIENEDFASGTVTVKVSVDGIDLGSIKVLMHQRSDEIGM